MSAGEASFLLAYFYSLYRVARNSGFTQGTHTVVLFENMYFYYTQWRIQTFKRGGGGEGGGHPDPEIRWSGFFRPFGPQFGLRIRGWGGSPPGPLPWIRHCHVLNKNENTISVGYWVLPKHRKK